MSNLVSPTQPRHRIMALVASAIGAIAAGAFAIGVLANRRLAIQRVVINRAGSKSVEIQELSAGILLVVLPTVMYAGLVLSLVMLRYLDEAALSPIWKWLARTGTPIVVISIPAALFLSVVSPRAKEPSRLINLAYAGVLFLAWAVLTLGIGLIRAAKSMR